jgi:hypothetical protein
VIRKTVSSRQFAVRSAESTVTTDIYRLKLRAQNSELPTGYCLSEELFMSSIENALKQWKAPWVRIASSVLGFDHGSLEEVQHAGSDAYPGAFQRSLHVASDARKQSKCGAGFLTCPVFGSQGRLENLSYIS